MTLLNTYSLSSAAYIAKGMLEAHGIPCQVMADALSSIFPTPDSGADQYALYADNDDDAPRAMELLREHGDA